MIIKKTLIASILALTICVTGFSLTGCGGNNEDMQNGETNDAEWSEATPEEEPSLGLTEEEAKEKAGYSEYEHAFFIKSGDEFFELAMTDEVWVVRCFCHHPVRSFFLAR